MDKIVPVRIDEELLVKLQEIADREYEGNLSMAIRQFLRNELERRENPKNLEVRERFWGRVDRSGGPDACWLWAGCQNGRGYGTINAWGQHWLAHQLAWLLTTGERIRKDTGLLLRHTCDNGLCCNPSHLIPGTQLDNSDDRIERICDQVGEHNYAAKLTQEQVDEIRRRCANGESQKDVAIRFGIGSGHVCLIVNGRIWKDTYDGEVRPRLTKSLTAQQIEAIKQEYNPQFVSQNQLAEKYGVGRATIRRVLNGEYVGELDTNHKRVLGPNKRIRTPKKQRPPKKYLFTIEQVAEIRKDYAIGVRQSELAKRYGVTNVNIWNVVHNKNYKDTQ